MQTIEIAEIAGPVKKEKVERRNILGLADAHFYFYFKTTSAQHAVDQLRQMYLHSTHIQPNDPIKSILL